MINLSFVPVISGNPFDPAVAQKIPKAAGVYIIGVNQTIKNESIFCPLYTGKILKDTGLKNRIRQHYNPLGKSSFNSCNELFDLSADMHKVYSDIELWNHNYSPNWLRKDKDIKLINFFNSIINNHNSLIWFNTEDGLFFNNYFQNKVSNYAKNIGHIGMEGANGEFASLSKAVQSKQGVHDLMRRYFATKSIILKNFSFTFAAVPILPKTSGLSRKSILECEEAATKIALELRGVWTYSKANCTNHGHVNVDFSALKNLYKHGITF